MKRIGRTSMVSLVILLISVSHIFAAADILSDKPYYILTELTIFFQSESKATLILNYSWYGMMATDIEDLLSKYPGGETNYTQGFLDYVSRNVEGPFIAGDFELYPSKMEAKISREREGNYTKRVSLTLIAELDAKKGAPRSSKDRKGVIYSTREDLCNLSKIYVREVDLLNVTVILPKDYVISLVRPTPNSIYTINSSDGIRVVASWVIRNPVVDTRGSAGYSGWFHIGAVNLTKEELEVLRSMRSSIAEIRKQAFLPLDEEGKRKAKELFDLFYKFSIMAPYE
ncbi:MAG: hypothetical protein RMI85_03310, partial [Candidatus Korarchaeum sp.]|nr:hypothetical protein [Candidatus Korarchaeum sp.]